MFRLIHYSLVSLILLVSLPAYSTNTQDEIIIITKKILDDSKNLSNQELITDVIECLDFIDELLMPIVHIIAKLEESRCIDEQCELKNKLLDLNEDNNIIKAHYVSCEICFYFLNEINRRISEMLDNSNNQEYFGFKVLKNILLDHVDTLIKIPKTCDPLFYPKIK